MCVSFLVLACMFVYGLLDFSAHQLHKIHALGSFFVGLGPTHIPMILDRSAILIELTTVTHVVTLEWIPMFLA